MSIEKIQIESGFAVKFPFAFKDKFKLAFPTAKWNGAAKQWEVGSRSGKRLDQWIAIVTGNNLAPALLEIEEKEMRLKEIQDLETELARIKNVIKNKQDYFKTLNITEKRLLELNQLIADSNEKLTVVSEQVETAKKNVALQRSEMRKELSKIINFDAIESAKDEMERWHKPGSVARGKFDDAQEIIRKQRKLLNKAGWDCSGLCYLLEANHNRPDRDCVSNMSSGAMEDFFRIDDEE